MGPLTPQSLHHGKGGDRGVPRDDRKTNPSSSAHLLCDFGRVSEFPQAA